MSEDKKTSAPKKNICKSENCESIVYALRLCRSHYGKFCRKNKGVKRVKEVIERDPCKAEGCINEGRVLGLCRKHYSRLHWSKRKESLVIGFCKIEGCDNKSKSLGFCNMHYQRERLDNIKGKNRKINKRKSP